MIRKDKKPTAGLLFGVAAIQFLLSLLGWSIYGINFTWQDWLVTFGFVAYALLGVWACWAPVAPAILGLLLYAAFLGVQGYHDLELLKCGWEFKAPMLLMLLIAVVAALAAGRMKPSTDAPPVSA
jgi:hypothetical protein